MNAELTPCQKLCIEDCTKALANLVDLDLTSIAGVCPRNCAICLYSKRFVIDDVNWIPEPSDVQYNHWFARG